MELEINQRCMMCDELDFFGGEKSREEQMLRSLPLIVVTLVSL